MKQISPLLEAIQDIYWQERGVSFGEHDTRIVWRNPTKSPDGECGLDPLLLESVPDKDFNLVAAHVIVGWNGDCINITRRSLQEPSEYQNRFAERLIAAYDIHDHELCLASMESKLERRKVQTASFAHRDFKTGEVIKL